jgi:hypothetical protein
MEISEEIHIPKNLKVLTFPAAVNYNINNDKFIIEEVSFVVNFDLNSKITLKYFIIFTVAISAHFSTTATTIDILSNDNLSHEWRLHSASTSEFLLRWWHKYCLHLKNGQQT